jgi:gliding motility-associated-like protein
VLSSFLKKRAAIKRCLFYALFLVASNIAAAQTCIVTNTVPANPPTSGVFDILVAASGSVHYEVRGVLIYDSYDTTGVGNATPIPGSPYFWQGPLARSGVWAKGNPLTMSYNVCINITTAKTYYMGFAADNSGRLVIDGKVIVSGIDFSYWRIYKVPLTKGKHIVGFTVVNFGGPAALGCEIYDNTKEQILKSTSYGDLNVIFTTIKEIGATVQQGDPATSYSCPLGFALDYCEPNSPVCTQFVPINVKITDPPPACLSTGVDITSPQITAGSPSSLSYTYWQDSLATIPLNNPGNIKTSGTYYIKGASDSCSMVKPVSVVVKSTAVTVNSVICLGNSYGGHTKSGTYIDTLISSSGCDSIRTLNLTVKIQADTSVSVTVCRGDGYRGHTRTGIYTDTLHTANGCDSLVTTNLTVNPNVDLGPDKQLCLGDSITLSPGPFRNYLWQDGSTLPYYKVKTDGIYWVKVADENGCTGADTIAIKEITCIPSKFPNTFTPNGDGINDTWDINGLGAFPQCTVFVYSRWGQLVFKSTGYPTPWDGRENGKDLPIGTYYYIINLKNNTPPISGYVTIIR